MVKYKKEPISDKNMGQHLDLLSNNSDFKYFNSYVNGECQKAIGDMYGKFLLLSSPILTQALLSSFAERFKATFPTQYKAIMCFINKGGSFNEKLNKNKLLWYHYALYIFCILVPIRNQKTFIWWEMCNSASHYGHGCSNLTVLFGIYISQTSHL